MCYQSNSGNPLWFKMILILPSPLNPLGKWNNKLILPSVTTDLIYMNERKGSRTSTSTELCRWRIQCTVQMPRLNEVGEGWGVFVFPPHKVQGTIGVLYKEGEEFSVLYYRSSFLGRRAFRTDQSSDLLQEQYLSGSVILVVC